MEQDPNSNNNQETIVSQQQWDSLKTVPLNSEITPAPEKSFTESELERIANAVGRVPDDPEVIKMNLVLRYQKFQQYQDLIKDSQEKHTMVQSGTLEDFATAKRELEAAMYTYDDAFAKYDAKAAGIDEEQKRYNTKLQFRDNKHMGEGPATPENSWVQARIAKGQDFDREREQIADKRESAAERLIAELPKMVDDMENTKIYKTYEIHKDETPVQPISARRHGTEGIYDNDHQIDFTLNPQPSEVFQAQPNTENNTKATPEIEIKIELKNQLDADMAEAQRLEALQSLVEAQQEADALENLQTAVEAEQDTTTSETSEFNPERLEALEKQLDNLRTELAELFVKRSRIFGPKHWEEYDEAKAKYTALRDEYLRLKSETSQDEAAALENYLQEDHKLLAEVNNRVDNGNLYRKISRIFGNKYYKQAMLAYGVRSLGIDSAEEVGSAQASNQASTQISPETPPETSPEALEETAPEPNQPTEEEESQTSPTPSESSSEASQSFSEQDDLRSFQDELSRTEVGTLVGPAGVELMSMPNPTNSTDRPGVIQRIDDWWSYIPDFVKDAVRAYEATQADSPYGGHLRLYLAQLDQAAAESASSATAETTPETTPESAT